jgi:hypothetical protein
MKFDLVTISIILITALPTHAQSVDELRQQLDTQKQINEVLKQRIRSLEKQLSETLDDNTSEKIYEESLPVPDKAPSDSDESRALERALVRQGLSILSSGTWELTPGVIWVHSGSDAIKSTSDDYIAALDVRVGLPWTTMLGIGMPYYIKSKQEAGDDSGFGDLSLRVWKQFMAQGDTNPSLVGSLNYIAPTGEASDIPGALGSDFHSLGVQLNASKTIDPMVLYGDLFYNYVFSERINGIKIQPGSYIGARGGISLAITPEMTGNIGLSISFIGELEEDGIKIDGSEQTVGFLELGAGYLINKWLFFSLFADIGITDDAPDIVLGVSLPTRF